MKAVKNHETSEQRVVTDEKSCID